MPSPDMPRAIRAAFERWSAGDHSFDPETMHPEIEIRSVAGLLTGGVYRGPEGVAHWARDITESFDEWSLEIDEIEEPRADRVFAVGTVHFRGRESGIVIDAPCGWVFEHRDGRVTRFEVFANRVAEGREAASR